MAASPWPPQGSWSKPPPVRRAAARLGLRHVVVKQLRRLADRDSGKRRGHVQGGALKQRRHELTPRKSRRYSSNCRKKKAIVALARRLAVIMHRMWSDGTEFRWTREMAPTI